ncbi:glycosyltransferase family 4 protein [Chelativorans sp. AA-79]|uniref:glycosyltransferase family 4 protein n=1 Tax=Chelativorans sp. AA-79 TaxID=3028735 RepID=UPI0023F976DE|nr:glycosyltransferase family 4 protein [Chelativorans sp. AA-79]WEX10477.1 glycosyltransferase family 4 protein [Chelativorans sp. AA-79]
MADPKPDRVVIINDRSAAIGGASNLSILLRESLRERGVSVTFFAGDRADPADAEEDSINLGARPLLERGRLSAFAGGLYNAPAYEALSRFIRASDTPSTIYHLHGWSKILSPAVFRALGSVRARTVLHAHDYFLVCPNGGFVNYPGLSVCKLAPMSVACLATQCDKHGFHQKLWRSTRHALRQTLFDIRRRPAHIVLVHDAMRSYFDRAGVAGEHIVTVRNPVEPFLREPADPGRSRDFFFIGRLEPEKGFEDAARAARMANVTLHVIGDGAGRGLLERYYPETVLHGWRKREEIAELVRHARAVVVSSRVPEPFGLAALEALGSGIPVILPSEALLSREIVEADCGLSFKSGDVEGLSAAMRALADDEEAACRMGRNGFREARHMGNTPESWADALMSLYAGVLEQARLAAA